MPDVAAAKAALTRLDKKSRVKFDMANFVKGGNVCYAYCSIWILRYNINHTESVSNRIDILKQPGVSARAKQAQRNYATTALARAQQFVSGAIATMDEVESGAMAATLSGFSLAFDGEARNHTSNIINQIETQVNVVGRYSVIGLSENRTAGKGHAICTYRSHSGVFHSGHLHVFDPNWGEWKLGSGQAEVQTFFTTLQDLYTAFDSGALFNAARLGTVRFTGAALINPWG
ncbi:MAG: hypothetical protein JWO38_2169 [Gemmataceae bacterium]|nr:hypothetical protein [Gemmataceae bacterium]